MNAYTYVIYFIYVIPRVDLVSFSSFVDEIVKGVDELRASV